MGMTKNTLNEKEMELVRDLVSECRTTGDIQEKLKRLFAGTIEQMLEAEMEEHLGYEKNSIAGNNSGNSRNGYGKKTIISDYGDLIRDTRNHPLGDLCAVDVPKGIFDVPLAHSLGVHRQDLLLDLVRSGLTLAQNLGLKFPVAVTRNRDLALAPEVNEWQNRPLDKIYPVIYFDGIVFNTRKGNRIISKCVYSVLGINMEGQKDILGTWISENESASFYASICADLKNRGVSDVFIACHDNLTGLSEAINSIFPKTKSQLFIIHQVRNSCKFVPYKDRKAVCADLKKIYGAVNLDDAEYAKEEFREKWDRKYPNILKSWDKNWAELTAFFEYPDEIRKIIYTTNAVEGYHRMVRKFTKTKAIFPTDDSIRKAIYMSVKEISKKWTVPVRDWGLAYAQFSIFFEDRFAA